MSSRKIPPQEIDFSFVRSSGPGGQNVNKVNSKAVLRWKPGASQAFGPFERARALAWFAPLLNHEGELVLTSDQFRDQGRNREDCLEKLEALVAKALFVPKARKESRPSYSSKLKAKKSKQLQSRKKALRRDRGD